MMKVIKNLMTSVCLKMVWIIKCMKYKKDLIYIFIISICFIFYFAKVDEYNNIIVSKTREINILKKEIVEKQDVVDELNSSIDGAKGSSDTSYDEMVEALDNLEIIE